jgi:hypothetical protein
MVLNIFKHIGDKIKAQNPFVDSYALNAIKLPNGDLIGITKIKTEEAIGIDDSLGNSFYIKIADSFTFSEGLKLSSCLKEYSVLVPFTFVFFSPAENNNMNAVELAFKFANDLRKITYEDYVGEERKINILLSKNNINSIDVFEKETGFKYESMNEMKIISIDANLKFLLSSDCDNICDIIQTPCINEL